MKAIKKSGTAKMKYEASMQNRRKAAFDLLYLTACAVNEMVPERDISENGSMIRKMLIGFCGMRAGLPRCF